jgi:hypothetical protein
MTWWRSGVGFVEARMLARLEIAPRRSRVESPPNNSFNPTRLSIPLKKIGCWNLACMVTSAVGLIRALGF